jgi:uncharacterized protein GlcG (DUF336 family)
MNRHLGVVLAVILAGAGLTTGPVLAQGLPVEKVLPLSLATEAAQSALAACEQQGFRVSVAVTDRAGVVRVLIRGDGAGPHTVDSSSRKAYASASLRRSTMDLAKIAAEDPTLEEIRHLNEKILLVGGGLSIKAGEEVVGGIGVGGAPGADKDEACARAGLDQIKDRLK